MTRHPWPKAVLFDLDDTLWPIVPVIRAAETILYTWLQQHAPRVADRFTIAMASVRDAPGSSVYE